MPAGMAGSGTAGLSGVATPTAVITAGAMAAASATALRGSARPRVGYGLTGLDYGYDNCADTYGYGAYDPAACNGYYGYGY